jgi:hypothetical protein
MGTRLADALDDLDQLVSAVALLTSEADKLTGTSKDGPALGSPRHVDSASASELQQPLVSEQAERAEHGVRVHAKHRGEVTGRRQSFTGLCLAVGDSATNLGGDLLEQVGLLLTVNLDAQHRDTHTSTT